MKGLQYSTRDILDGPWLLDTKALEDIDEIVLKHWELLETRRNQILDLVIENEIRKYEKQKIATSQYVDEQIDLLRRSHPTYSVSYLQFRIQYKKSTYFCESFDSALRARVLSDVVAEGFAIELVSGDVECRIDLNKMNGLTIDIAPQEMQETQDLFHDLSQWATNNRASYLQRLWGKVADLGYRLYIGVLIVLSTVFAFMNLLKSNTDVINAQAAARQLLDQGVSTSNLPEAVKLLLQMQILDRGVIVIPSWFRVVLLSILFLCIVLPIRPKVVLGIGKGGDYIGRWKIWQKIIGATIPLLILSNFIVPYFVGLIKQIIKTP